MLIETAKLWRAKFRGGKRFWIKRKINRIYSQHTNRFESHERTVYVVLLMVIINASEGKVVDIWFHPGSFHERKGHTLKIA